MATSLLDELSEPSPKIDVRLIASSLVPFAAALVFYWLAPTPAPESGYSFKVGNAFVNVCDAQKGKTRSSCQCIFDALERTLPFEEFRGQESLILSGDIPSASKDAVARCKKQTPQ